MTPLRRWVGCLLAALTLNMAVAPSVSLAMSEKRQAPSDGFIVQIIGRDGVTVRGSLEGNDWIRGASESLRDIRGVNPVVLDSLREALAHLESSSPIGRKLVPGMIKVLNVLTSTSQSEYIMRAGELPVSFVSRDSIGTHGNVIKVTEAYSGGKLRIRTLRTDADPAIAPPCTYVDEDNVVWSGACATPSEISAAMATYAAMEAEADQTESAINSQKIDYCETAEGRTDTYCNDVDERMGRSGPAADCAGQGLGFAGALINYVWRASRLAAAIFAINPVAGAITESVVLGAAALAAVVGTAVILANCMNATESAAATPTNG